MSKKMRANTMLMLTAIIWGTAFVAQKSGMELVGPIGFNGIRTLLGGIVLIPVILFMSKLKGKKGAEEDVSQDLSPEEKEAAKQKEKKLLIVGGIACGIALMLAGNIQQVGLFYTTAGKTAFITPLYVVIVPLLSVLLGKKIRPIIWPCVLAAVAGLYLLCIPADGGFGHVNKGDLIVLVCAVFFAIHIMCVDYFSPKVDGVKLSCIQFLVGGVLSIILMFPLDPALGFDLPTISDILNSWVTIGYAGIMSCGVAYTLQVVAQADTDPTSASLILCLESVFGVIAGMLILSEAMSVREVIGCIVMFAVIIITQLPSKEERLAAKKDDKFEEKGALK